jgi:malate synthase
MSVPFMHAYAQRLVHVCHRRGAHAIGGMAAFIPNRRDPVVNAVALAKVREDKERESALGFDGTWVAHPDLVPVAVRAFDAVLRERPHQKDRGVSDAEIDASRLIDAEIPGGAITGEGIRMNVEVALLYLEAWLRGIGAVAIHNLMEDAATAEISRTQLWQWIRHGAVIDAGGAMTREYYLAVRTAELARLRGEAPREHKLDEAAALLDVLVLEDFEEFLTVCGARLLD